MYFIFNTVLSSLSFVMMIGIEFENIVAVFLTYWGFSGHLYSISWFWGHFSWKPMREGVINFTFSLPWNVMWMVLFALCITRKWWVRKVFLSLFYCYVDTKGYEVPLTETKECFITKKLILVGLTVVYCLLVDFVHEHIDRICKQICGFQSPIEKTVNTKYFRRRRS